MGVLLRDQEVLQVGHALDLLAQADVSRHCVNIPALHFDGSVSEDFQNRSRHVLLLSEFVAHQRSDSDQGQALAKSRHAHDLFLVLFLLYQASAQDNFTACKHTIKGSCRN